MLRPRVVLGPSSRAVGAATGSSTPGLGEREREREREQRALGIHKLGQSRFYENAESLRREGGPTYPNT